MHRRDGKEVKDWNALVGSRCLVVQDRYAASGYEVCVLEVSPSRKRVKFRFPSGAEVWETAEEWLLIEKLEVKNG